jgi:hypothetical protein
VNVNLEWGREVTSTYTPIGNMAANACHSKTDELKNPQTVFFGEVSIDVKNSIKNDDDFSKNNITSEASVTVLVRARYISATCLKPASYD